MKVFLDESVFFAFGEKVYLTAQTACRQIKIGKNLVGSM